MHKQNHRYDLQIVDVNHHDSQVWVRFEDGRSVTLSGQQILDAAREHGGGTDAEGADGGPTTLGEGTEPSHPA